MFTLGMAIRVVVPCLALEERGRTPKKIDTNTHGAEFGHLDAFDGGRHVRRIFAVDVTKPSCLTF
jgi:hypothetical protein